MNDELLTKLLTLEVMQYRKLSAVVGALGGGLDSFRDALEVRIHPLVLDTLGPPGEGAPGLYHCYVIACSHVDDGNYKCRRDAWHDLFQDICEGTAYPEFACREYVAHLRGGDLPDAQSALFMLDEKIPF